MGRVRKIWRNLVGGWGKLRRWFPPDTLARINAAIAASEQRHGGEIVFAVETRLHPAAAFDGVDARDRAQALFAIHRVWDTEQNIGVLTRVAQPELDALCATVVQGFREGQPERGVIAAIEALTGLLEPHFPHDPAAKDEICGAPIVV